MSGRRPLRARSDGRGRTYLTGFMGSGKSEVGRLLAARFDLPFVDLDREIEAAAGQSVAEIFAHSGEAEFRRREAAHLFATAELPAAVVATGGGVVLAAENRRFMREGGLVVWLDADFPVLASRLGREERRLRPLWRDPGAAERLWRERLPAYRDCDLALKVEPGESAGETARRLALLLEERACAT
jgi:shikimate kinase